MQFENEKTMEEDYETKKKMLFECLETAERGLQGSSLAQTTYNSDLENYRQQRHRSRDEYIDKYKHKDSMFKRPDLPISKCLKSRRRPDFEVSFTINAAYTFFLHLLFF